MKILTAEYPESYWRREAKKNGISDRRYRGRREEGMSPEQAATAPLRVAPGHVPDPTSRTQRSQAAGICDSAVSVWKRRHPEDTRDDDAIIEAIAENKRRRDESKRRKSRCAAKGISYHTVQSRMRREGIDFETALARPIMTKSEIGRRQSHNLKDRWK